MMPELALNVLDIAENSVRAEASLVEIEVSVKNEQDLLEIIIRDNGCGMTKEQVERVTDPFFTTRTTRKVGLGVPFFKQAAESAGGSFSIVSEPGKGTVIHAAFQLSHIDRMPLGDINMTIYTLAVFHEETDFWYKYHYDARSFEFDTREIKQILGDISFQEPEVSGFIKAYLEENKRDTDGGIEI